MKQFIIITIILFVFGCSEEEEKQEKSAGRKELENRVDKNNDSLDNRSKFYLENTKIEFGDPIVLASTGNIAIPIIFDEKYVDKDMPHNSHFNIAILDSQYNFKKLLFEGSVIIDEINTIEKRIPVINNYYNEYEEDYEDESSKEFNSLIFFDLWEFKNRKQDYRRLFVYDLKNDALRQLSIPNTNVAKWNVIKGQNAVYITYYFDTNKDGEYDGRDDENVCIVGLKDTLRPKNIFELGKLKEIKLKVALENK